MSDLVNSPNRADIEKMLNCLEGLLVKEMNKNDEISALMDLEPDNITTHQKFMNSLTIMADYETAIRVLKSRLRHNN